MWIRTWPGEEGRGTGMRLYVVAVIFFLEGVLVLKERNIYIFQT